MNLIIGNQQSFSKRPPGLHCYICGKEYGSASLRLHVKTCLQQWDYAESKKPSKLRKPHPRPPIELLKIYDTLKKGGKVDPKIIDLYNEKAIENWERDSCFFCEYCKNRVPKTLMSSHHRICTQDFPEKPLPSTKFLPSYESHRDSRSSQSTKPSEEYRPSIRSLTPSTQTPRIVEPFRPYKPLFVPSIKSGSLNFLNSIETTSSNDYRYDSSSERSECPHCNRKFTLDRIERHKKACEELQRGREKHDFMVFQAKTRKAKLDAFKEYEKKYVTHKWVKQHQDIHDIVKDYPKKKQSVKFKEPHVEFFYQDYSTCDCCNKTFHTSSIKSHAKNCYRAKNERSVGDYSLQTIPKPEPKPIIKSQTHRDPYTSGLKKIISQLPLQAVPQNPPKPHSARQSLNSKSPLFRPIKSETPRFIPIATADRVIKLRTLTPTQEIRPTKKEENDKSDIDSRINALIKKLSITYTEIQPKSLRHVIKRTSLDKPMDSHRMTSYLKMSDFSKLRPPVSSTQQKGPK